MKKKFLGRVLTMLLVASMVFTLLPAPAIAAGNWWWNNDEYTEEAVPTATTTADNSDFMRIFHLDCGRKYFTKDEIFNIIDTAAKCGYTHVELAFGNDGLRFLLDDMSLTANDKYYGSNEVTAAIQYGNAQYNSLTYYNQSTNELTEGEMLEILAHASEAGIGIIPMFDAPGHMYALIKGMQDKLQLTANYRYATKSGNNSQNWALILTDANNADSVAFVKALMQKYIDFFAKNGAGYFNIAADECGFVSTVNGTPINATTGEYAAFAGFVNEMNSYVKSHKMIAMAFNDGFYHKNMQIAENSFDTDILICYWDASANSYAQAADLVKKGFSIINTNNRWYYVIGKERSSGSNWSQYAYHLDYAIECMGKEDCLTIDGDGKQTTPVGCMTAVWCDNPGATYLYTSVESYMAAMQSSNPDYFKSTAAPDKPGTKLDEREITVTVGGTATDTIEGSYQGTYEPEPAGFATVEATIKAAGTGEVKVGDKIAVNNKNLPATVTGVISDGNGNYMMVSGNTIENTKEVSKATQFTVTRRQNGTNGFKYEINSGDKYLMISSNGVAISSSYYDNNRYDNDNGFYYYGKYSDYYLYYNAYGSWSSHYSMSNGFLYATVEEGTSEQTIVTFNGLAEGTTDVTIGNVHYTIHVTKEDLSNAPTLPIQLWITSQTIAVDQDGMKSKSTSGNFGSRKPQYLEISATDKLNTPEGRPLSECVPELIEKHYENDGTWWTTKQSGKQPFDFMLWKGTVLTGANLQGVWGESCINKGTDFAYVRYLGGKWEVSNDRSKWTTVTGTGSTSSSSNCTEQLVAYYYMQTKLTDDVTTNIVDWGDPYESQTAADYVLLDFTVKTETGEATPAISSFPMEKRTLYYHCNGNADTCGTDSNNYKYRRIDQIEARNTGEYEIYMITLTPTADSAAKKLASTCNGNAAGSGIYQGTEKVVWVKDADTLQKTEFTDETLWYTSPSGKTFDPTDTTGEYVGGKAELSNVEIYNKQGLLVTYYVRSTAVHKVYVHYIDNKTNTPFHTVEISVPTGTTYFDPNFGMASGKLINNIVAGVNHPETVQSDLQQLPLVPAQYRRANYTLTAANLGGNTTAAKDAYLYYDFSNTESFVVDFGLPLTITPKDVGNLGTATINRTKISYNGGLADISATTNGTITYKLNKPLGKTADSFSVTYTGPSLSGTETKGDVDVTFTIYIYPASNVLYEENFLTQSNESGRTGWTEYKFDTAQQQTQKLKEQQTFGFDTAYEGVTSARGYWTASNLMSKADSTKSLTTNFYGNAIDVIGSCGPKTGIVMVSIKNAATGKPVKSVVIETTYTAGTIDQVPLAHIELGEGNANYTAIIRGYAPINAAQQQSGSLMLAADYYGGSYDALAADLAEMGLSLSDVEFIRASGAAAKTASTRRAAQSYALETVAEGRNSDNTVTIDGFRVYRSANNEAYAGIINEYQVTYCNILKVMEGKVITAYVDNGAVTDCNVSEYEKLGGPQNEIYLQKNQVIAFKLFKDGSAAANQEIQISLSAVSGTTQYNKTNNISSTMEMYYTLTTDENGIVSITNTGDNLLAIGNVKVPAGCTTIAPNGIDTQELVRSINLALNAAPETPDVGFDPAISAKVTTTRFIRSKVVTLTVSASSDVAVLKVNGVELRPTNSWLVKMGWSDTYTYILTEKVQKSEIKTYEIVGYRADGAASETFVVKSK